MWKTGRCGRRGGGYICLGYDGVGGVGCEWVMGLAQCLRGWFDVMSVVVVSLDSLC